ncbi:exonuclease SbcC [Vibrio coralliilyticus]|uniref:AAA family ATPase n=1 Tax=Vibrio coralliilyticus TaxID=190893 RepID=UPI000BAC1E88|nr:AAA family ATPase [Vibrio coralliilyticus]NOI77504.1 exonuclease SbcC [Vibrio coralliilyticus]PAW02549.1 hypothetical protein CKJ79_15110 [Vibrio coralliilyticus]
MPSNIQINHLIVVGRNKNYTVNFNPGVNIIYGDSATGKSSILNLIDYLLGAKSIDLYPEIESAAKYAILDVTLCDDRYTIKRDIFNPSKPIEVYPCSHGEIDNFACKRYLPTYQPSATYPDAGFYSDFLLDSLNLNKIKIKESPSKADSKLVRLSFRDIFKYCYVDQDDLGSKKFLSSDNYALQVRYKEVFKYIFNALDNNISQLQAQISEKTSKKKDLEKTFTTVSNFLRESEFGTMVKLDEEVDKIDDEIKYINSKIAELNKTTITDNEVYNAIKSELDDISLKRKSILHDLYQENIKVERFTRLKNEYLSDIQKFKSALASREVIGEIPIESTLCPVCDNIFEVESAKERFDICEKENLTHEINLLKRRAQETEHLASEAKSNWERLNTNLRDIDSAEKIAIELQEKNTKELTSPYLAERDIYVGKVAELKQKRQDLISRLKIRNQHSNLTKSIKSLEISLDKLGEELDELRKNSPSMAEVLSNLADNLQDYLRFVKIKSPNNISYDGKSFSPKVRNIEYSKLTSGGLRTIVGIGYLCSLMKEALKPTVNYPSLLMIDTVGKYLGKTKEQKYKIDQETRKADNEEAVSDPEKYQNIYEYILDIAEEYENNMQSCQFILVDNDVPDHIMDKLSSFIVAHYSSERIDGLPVGFIDDAE